MSVDPPQEPPGPEPPANPSRWERWLVWGPAGENGDTTLLLPWWGRWLVVIGAAVLGYSWRDLGLGQELSWFLA
jgi:hypothetical protein